MMELSIPKCSTTNIEIRTPFQEQSTLLHLDAVPPFLWGSTWHPELNCIRNAMDQIANYWVWFCHIRMDSYVRTFLKPISYWTVKVTDASDHKIWRALLTWMMTMAALRLRCSTAALSSTGRAFPIFSMLVKPAECNCLALSTKLLMKTLLDWKSAFLSYNMYAVNIIVMMTRLSWLDPHEDNHNSYCHLCHHDAHCPPWCTDSRQFKQGKKLRTGAGGKTSRKRLQQFLGQHRTRIS